MIRDLAEGRSRFCELERSLAGISPAHPLAAPARARGGGHRRAPDVPRGPAARRVRADREGPRAGPDRRVDADLRPRVAGRRRRVRRGARARSTPSPPEPSSVRARCCNPACARKERSRRGGERAAHAQPRPARLARAPSSRRPPWQLAEEVSGGAEVPFELIEQGRATAPAVLLPPADRPLHRRARSAELAKLAVLRAGRCRASPRCPTCPAYLQARGRRAPSPDARAQADAALQAFLTAVWAESTDFAFDRERFDAAFAELEEAVYGDRTLRGRARRRRGPACSRATRSPLGDGLALVRAETLRDVPDELLLPTTMGTVAMLALDAAIGDDRALEGAGRRLRRLQTALRLWDDAEPSLGPTAWARTDGGAWQRRAARRPASAATPATACSAPRRRTRCARSARSSPAARRAAASWPGRCGASSSAASAPSRVEALTDWLLAGRALLAEPGRPRLRGSWPSASP